MEDFSRDGGESGGIESGAVECCCRGTPELGVDLGEKIIGEIGLAGSVGCERAFGRAAVGDFEVVHGQDSLDQMHDFAPLFLVGSDERPGEFGKNDRIDEAGRVLTRGPDEASRAFALCGIVVDEETQQHVCIDADHPSRLLRSRSSIASLIASSMALSRSMPASPARNALARAKSTIRRLFRASSRIDPSGSCTKRSRSPADMSSALRKSFGTVIWPLLVTVASPKSCSACLTLTAPSCCSLLLAG